MRPRQDAPKVGAGIVAYVAVRVTVIVVSLWLPWRGQAWLAAHRSRGFPETRAADGAGSALSRFLRAPTPRPRPDPLQDALQGRRFRRGRRFHRHLHHEQVPPRHGPGAGHQQPRRFHHARFHHARSQSRGRGAETRRPAAKSGAGQVDAAKGSQAATARGRIALPAPRAADHGPPGPVRQDTFDRTRSAEHIRAWPHCECAATCIDCVSRKWEPPPSLSQRRVNERIVESRSIAVRSDDRSVRPDHRVFANLGDRSLRPALLLLHVRGHDIFAEGGSAHAGRTRPAVLGVHRQGRARRCGSPAASRWSGAT